MAWITPDGEYYDAGDSVAEGSIQVPQRPDNLHSFVNGSWVLDQDKVRESTVPKKVTMRQAQEALLEDGSLDLVEATINAMQGVEGRRAKIQWTKSQDVYRNWPLVIQLGPVIGKTPEQLDQLFIKAATL